MSKGDGNGKVSVDKDDLAWALKYMTVDGGHTREVKGRLQSVLDSEPHSAERATAAKTVTIPEFAALCRERCATPAQGFDDERPCGSTSEGEDGQVFHFCGYHWMACPVKVLQ